MTPRQRYNKLCAERQDIIRQNAGRRIKGLPALPVPPKPQPPMGWELIDEDGMYYGFTNSDEEMQEFLGGNPKRKANRKEALH